MEGYESRTGGRGEGEPGVRDVNDEPRRIMTSVEGNFGTGAEREEEESASE